MNRHLALSSLLISGLLACNTPELVAGEQASSLTSQETLADTLLSSLNSHGTPLFLECHSAPGASPALELAFFSATHAGRAAVKIRLSTPKGMGEWITTGTLDGIPRAGDLQGQATFTLGMETVSFEYFAETEDAPNEVILFGNPVELLCNVLWTYAN